MNIHQNLYDTGHVAADHMVPWQQAHGALT